MAEYIEREALIRRIKEIHCAECDSYHGIRCRACWVDDTLDYIGSEPSADVAPVRHGMWISFNESEISGFNPEFAGCDPIAGYRCSKCGAEAILDCNDQFVLSKYCYDCGAKMDLEEK